MNMDSTRLKKFVDGIWDDAVVPSLTEYIRIPNKSPAFDPADGDVGAEQVAGIDRRDA
jgi:hypothetical protein